MKHTTVVWLMKAVSRPMTPLSRSCQDTPPCSTPLGTPHHSMWGGSGKRERKGAGRERERRGGRDECHRQCQSHATCVPRHEPRSGSAPLTRQSVGYHREPFSRTRPRGLPCPGHTTIGAHSWSDHLDHHQSWNLGCPCGRQPTTAECRHPPLCTTHVTTHLLRTTHVTTSPYLSAVLMHASFQCMP